MSQLGSAVDRSGILGWFIDPAKIVQSALTPSPNQTGFGSVLTGLAGPTGSTVDKLYSAMFGVPDQQGPAVRRLLPLNNALGIGDLLANIAGSTAPRYDVLKSRPLAAGQEPAAAGN